MLNKERYYPPPLPPPSPCKHHAAAYLKTRLKPRTLNKERYYPPPLPPPPPAVAVASSNKPKSRRSYPPMCFIMDWIEAISLALYDNPKMNSKFGCGAPIPPPIRRIRMSALPGPRRRILPATPSTALTTSRPGDLGAGPLQTKQPFGLTAGCGGHASWTHGPQHQGGEPRARDAAQLRSCGSGRGRQERDRDPAGATGHRNPS